MNQDLLNGARIATIVVASGCMILMALRAHRARIINGDTFTVYATGALLVAMLLAVVSQATQIGHPLKNWWGSPMLALITLLTLAALAKSKVPWR